MPEGCLPATASAVVSLAAVERRIGDRWILRGVDLTIARGERVALLGESGSGKSTLLNIVAGLEPADGGTVRVCGETLGSRDPDASARLRRRSIGFVFQAYHLLPHLSLESNVELPLLLAGEPPRAARGRSRDLLAAVGLASRATDLPARLSGGEQQRVAIARALATRPALVIADEPTGNLDPRTGERILALIDAEIRACGAALLLATHSAQAAAIAPRTLRLAWPSGDLAHEGARLEVLAGAQPAARMP